MDKGKKSIGSLLRRHGILVESLGAAFSSFAALAGLCCFGFTLVSTMLLSAGLGFLVDLKIVRLLLYFALGIALSGSIYTFFRCRNPFPLTIAAAAAFIMLYPYHVPLELSAFLGMIYGGILVILTSVFADIRARKKCRI